MNFFLRVLFSWVLLMSASVWASALPSSVSAERLIEQFHSSFLQLSDVGDLDKIEKSLANLQTVQAKDAEAEAVVTIYHGAFEVLRARDSWNIFKKKSYLNSGLNRMESVQADQYQDKLTLYTYLLTIRGLSNAGVPDSFQRASYALRDLQTVVTLPSYEQMDPEVKQTIHQFIRQHEKTL